jgi:tetratricopeptide (TPR) repeat protein
MAFEKAKVLKAAEKLLSQGKISAAIKEYRQIVQHDNDDFTALNMLGDLCARAGEKDEAISSFLRIAEHYREQEFTLKAIAMYKKIERLKPHDPEIANKLAKLYAAQGLVVDARAQYLIVADAYTRAGETKQTLKVLHKIADLDRNNTDIRLKLAAGYLQEGLGSEAAKAFIEAASRLFDIGAFEKSLESYTKALELGPHDETALKGVVSAHVALGNADEAAEILERAVKNDPDDPELVSMLAQTYVEAEDPKGAERTTSMLMAHDASNYTRFIEVTQLYLKIGDLNEAARILASITEQMLAGREENDLLELVNEVLARDPEHVQGLRLLVRIHWWQRDMEKLRAALERLTEAAEAAGLDDEERYALTQLVRLAPDEPRYSARLTALGGGQEERADEPLISPEPALAEVPSFENFASAGDEEAGMAAAGADGSGQASEFEWNSVAELTTPDANASFADLNEILEESDAGFSSNVSTRQPGLEEFEFGGADVNPTSTAKIEPPQPDADHSRRESIMRQELESIDFYITQGYVDIALDTLEMLEREFGSHPEIDSRRQKLRNAAQVTGENTDVFEFGGAEQLGAARERQSEQIAAADADMTFATIEEQPTSSSSANTSPSPAHGGVDSGLAEIFEEFRIAAEEEQTPLQEDYETHYNMGIAYKEMDLLDEAIKEFQTAAGLLRRGDGTSRYLQCCNMLGHCFLQKGMARAAVIWFKKGLDSPGHSEDEYLALRYELGSAYEQMGDRNQALNMFTEVYGVNVSYRDVAEKLRSLQEQKGSSKKS